MDKNEKQFYEKTAKEYLGKFGNSNPTVSQIDAMESLLFNVWLRRKIVFNRTLSEQEKLVLLLASQGKSSKEIAKDLNISPGTVRNYEREITRKLNVKNMRHAVAIGIKYGEILQIA
jgi:DNA-binding CsgD family transcriptional regulator